MSRIKVESHTFDMDSFPRYRYTAYRVERLIRTGHSLQPNTFIKQSFGNVRIVVICDGRGRDCEHFTESTTDTFKAFESNTKRADTFTIEPTVCLIHTKCYRPRRNERHPSKLFLLTDDNQRAINDFKDAHISSIIIVTSTEAIQRNTNLSLERYACGVLRAMVERVINDPIEETSIVRQTDPTFTSFQSVRVLRQSTASNVPYTNGAQTDSDGGNICEKDLSAIKRKADVYASGSLRSGKRFRPSRIAEAARYKMDMLLLDVMALFKRSDVPEPEWPQVIYPEPQELNHKIVEKLFKVDASIVGCGYQHHILQIYLNREANAALDSTLTKSLIGHNIFHYHFNYGPCKYTPLCGIKVGSQLGIKHLIATLGGFARDNGTLYALVARHLVRIGNYIKYKHSNGEFTAIGVHTSQIRGELDIAAVKILPKTNIQDTRFRDSIGTFTNSVLFNFEDQTEARVRDSLQSEYIFAWTAHSDAQPSRGKITIPVFQRPNCQYKYVVIENETDEYADQGAVGPPVGESFGQKGDSGAIVCFDDKDGKCVHVVSMLMGKLDSHNGVGFLTLPLQQGLHQLSTILDGNLQLC